MAVIKENSLTRLLERIKGAFAQIKDTVFSVNGVAPVNGDVVINKVDLADNFDSGMSQTIKGSFITRTTGGSASFNDGDGWLMLVMGASVHTGYSPEYLSVEAEPIRRQDDSPEISASINRDTFVAAVQESGEYRIYYTTAWSIDPATWGITVTGTPVAGDVIVVHYEKEVRGEITNSNPQRLCSTGWNLFNPSAAYIRVVRYSDDYGYKIGGDFSKVEFANATGGERTEIETADGFFNVPADGYLFISGGNATTYVYTTWSDWIDGYVGEFMPYTQTTVDFSGVMSSYFPNGLFQVGNVRDEININLGAAISRIERMEYSDTNIAIAKTRGTGYEYDQNYIYSVKTSEDVYKIDVDGSYSVNEHGLEFIEGTTVPVEVRTIIGVNLKNRLERDVVTISSGLANNLTTTSAGMALDARQGKIIGDRLESMSMKGLTKGEEFNFEYLEGFEYGNENFCKITDGVYMFTIIVLVNRAISDTLTYSAIQFTNVGGSTLTPVGFCIAQWQNTGERLYGSVGGGRLKCAIPDSMAGATIPAGHAIRFDGIVRRRE